MPASLWNETTAIFPIFVRPKAAQWLYDEVADENQKVGQQL